MEKQKKKKTKTINRKKKTASDKGLFFFLNQSINIVPI